MKELSVTRAAEADILEIWAYLFDKSERSADRFTADITAKSNMLCEFPLLGRRRAEFGANYRSLPVGNYVIFYQILGTKLEISRVLHGSRDTSSLFVLEDEDAQDGM